MFDEEGANNMNIDILTPIEEENSLALQQEETDYSSSSSSSSSSRRKHNINNINSTNDKRHGKKRKSSSGGVLENENDTLDSHSKSTDITSSLWLIPIPIILGISFVGSFLILYFFFRRRISKLENEIKELRSSITAPPPLQNTTMSASCNSCPLLPSAPTPMAPIPPPPPPPPTNRVAHAPLPPFSYVPAPAYYDSNINSRVHNNNNNNNNNNINNNNNNHDINMVQGTNVPRAPLSQAPPVNAQQNAIPVVPRSSKEEVKILSETEMDRVLEKELAELGSSSSSSSLPVFKKDLEIPSTNKEKANPLPMMENIGQVIEVVEVIEESKDSSSL
jgi:hypothetical protein